MAWPFVFIISELSEPAREALEQEYGLTRARGRQQHRDNATEPPDLAAKVQEVTSSYRFASLDEFNAILAQFSMTAWPGVPGSAIRTNRGLLYSRIDTDGNRIGAPIKSSDLVTRPTLGWLEKRFLINSVKKLACRDRLADALTTIFATQKGGLMNILRRLEQRKIFLHAQADQQGELISVKIIDNRNKVVFTAEDLGLETDALLAQLGFPKIPTPEGEPSGQKTRLPTSSYSQQTEPARDHIHRHAPTNTSIAAQVAWTMLRAQASTPGSAADDPLKKKKRKKRSL
jgi:hypothetical protein